MKHYSSLIGLVLVNLVHETWTQFRQCTTLSYQEICNNEVQEAFKNALDYVKIRTTCSMINCDHIQDHKTTDVNMFRRHYTDPNIRSIETAQEPFELLSEIMIYRYKISEEGKQNLGEFIARGEYSDYAYSQCNSTRRAIVCNAIYPYRTATGECNNLNHKYWGSINTCFRRLLPAYYEGASDVRLGRDGNPLPDARTLSLNIHRHGSRLHKIFSHMYMYFGQLLAHDLTMSPISTITMDNENRAIQCCARNNGNHPQCAPIRISNNDPFYSNYGVRCQNFVRSSLCPTCKFGVREQMNQVTAFIDASFVYGNTIEETQILREFQNTGRLRVQITDAGELLPRSLNASTEVCENVNDVNYCFLAGDSRVNQHTVLAALHTLFVREHNRIADVLKYLNPHWEDERIFQEARRIVGAEMQVITYNEYLPITLGDDYMTYYNLYINSKGPTDYNPEVNPTLYTEFTTAAFRFGHSFVNSWVLQRKEQLAEKLFRDDFVSPFDIYVRGMIENYLLQATHLPSQFHDPHLVPDVTNFLFRAPGAQYGLDLAAFDIQRGRDHGLPPYIEALKACNLQKFQIQDFADLTYNNLMSQEYAELLRQNYRHVGDIDMWTGILSESPLMKSAVGPTAACIIALQFQKLKFGDRFYFEHRNQAGSFTPQQIKELKKTTLSSIICHNTRIRKIYAWAMLGPGQNNPIVNCEALPTIDLSLWKE